MSVTYQTQFGALGRYNNGHVEIIDDDVEHYAFSNCFEVAGNSSRTKR
jgi:hypothetical protein